MVRKPTGFARSASLILLLAACNGTPGNPAAPASKPDSLGATLGILTIDNYPLRPCSKGKPAKIIKSFLVEVPADLSKIYDDRYVSFASGSVTDVSKASDLKLLFPMPNHPHSKAPFAVYLHEEGDGHPKFPSDSAIVVYAATRAPTPGLKSLRLYRLPDNPGPRDAAMDGFALGKLPSGINVGSACRMDPINSLADKKYTSASAMRIDLNGWADAKASMPFSIGIIPGDLTGPAPAPDGETPVLIDPKIRNEG